MCSNSPDVERWRPFVSMISWVASCAADGRVCQRCHESKGNFSIENWMPAVTSRLPVANDRAFDDSRNTSRWRTRLCARERLTFNYLSNKHNLIGGREILTVILKWYDWCDGHVAMECWRLDTILREQHRCQIATVAPAISTDLCWIDDFEIVS